jgi:hypothetical protein
VMGTWIFIISFSELSCMLEIFRISKIRDFFVFCFCLFEMESRYMSSNSPFSCFNFQLSGVEGAKPWLQHTENDPVGRKWVFSYPMHDSLTSYLTSLSMDT